MSGGVLRVHPAVSPRYYGFYLQGFAEAFGWRVRLSTKAFPALGDPKAGLAAILPGGQRVFVAANDFAFVAPQVLAWADVVGQVNVDPDAARPGNVLPLGPSFGTPWASPASLTGFVVRSGAMTAPRRVPAMLRDYLRHQSDREPLSSYQPRPSDAADPIYLLANLWPNASEANLRRLRFLRAAASARVVRVEGGFHSTAGLPAEFGAYRVPRPVPHREYLERTARSPLVFNTPAVHGCLGWKLGEFLALGKAIVSTPLGRVMPGEFAPGVHYHLAEDDEDSLRDAVARVLGDDAYRRTLERNARQYWEDYLAPAAVAGRIVQAANERAGKGDGDD